MDRGEAVDLCHEDKHRRLDAALLPGALLGLLEVEHCIDPRVLEAFQ